MSDPEVPSKHPCPEPDAVCSKRQKVDKFVQCNETQMFTEQTYRAEEKLKEVTSALRHREAQLSVASKTLQRVQKSDQPVGTQTRILILWVQQHAPFMRNVSRTVAREVGLYFENSVVLGVVNSSVLQFLHVHGKMGESQ